MSTLLKSPAKLFQLIRYFTLLRHTRYFTAIFVSSTTEQIDKILCFLEVYLTLCLLTRYYNSLLCLADVTRYSYSLLF